MLFNAVKAPLAQPRNVYLGTLLSTIIGIAITKLFMLNPAMEDHLYLAAALSTAVSSVVMTITNTVHPPAGASAYLAAGDASVRKLGWFYIVVQIVIFLIITGTACVFDNLIDQYPLAWWSQEETGYWLPWAKKPAASSTETDKDSAIGVPATKVHTTIERDAPESLIVISGNRIDLPEHLDITEEDKRILLRLQDQLSKDIAPISSNA